MSQTISVPGVGDLEFPDGMSDVDMASAIKKNFPEIHPNPKQDRKAAAAVRQKPAVDESLGAATARTLGRAVHAQPKGDDSTLLEGLGETALSAISTPIAGLAGGLTALATQDSEAANKVRERFTYQPHTQSAKDVATMLSEPIRMGGEVVGDIAAHAGASMARSVGASEGTQMKIDAALRSTGESAIPFAMAGKGGAAAMSAAKAALAPKPGVFEKTPGGEQIPVAGKDYEPLRQFSPEEEARYKRLQDYKPTLGQVQRKSEQIRFEEHQGQRTAGEDLAERKADQNTKLAKKVETEYPIATKAIPDEVGGNLLRRSVQTKLDAKMADTSALYKKADRMGETLEEVETTPLNDLFKEHEDDIASGIAPELATLKARYERLLPKPKKPEEAGPALLDASGKEIPKPEIPPEPPKLSLRNLERLYQKANQVGNAADPRSLRFANEVKKTINEITDGRGGQFYQAARKSRLEQGMEFEEQGGVARVVDKQSKTDYKVDASKLWQNVLNGSIEDLKQTLRTVTRDIRPGNKSTALADATAVRALQRKTVERVLDQASKSATLVKGRPEFSPAGLKTELERGIGRDKLELLLGKKSTDRLFKIINDAIELKTSPDKVKGSDTANKLQMLKDQVSNRGAFLMEKTASKMDLPMIPGLLRWGREKMVEWGEKEGTRKAVEDALNPTKESHEKTAEIAKPQKKEISQIRMERARRNVRGAAAADFTMDRKRDPSITVHFPSDWTGER